MLVDTANREEVMADSHIIDQYTSKFHGSVQPELLNMTSYKPHKDNLSQNYDLDFLNNFNYLNILSKMNNATNNRANTTYTNIVNQEHQDYYNQRDQQYIGYKYNGSLERSH